jgi:hypothetical protein
MIPCLGKCLHCIPIDAFDKDTGFCVKNQDCFYLSWKIEDCNLFEAK